MSGCDNCCSGRPDTDGKFKNLVVCEKFSNKNLSAQTANIQQLTVGDLTVLRSETLPPVTNITTTGCGFQVPTDFPTIQEAVDAVAAAQAAGIFATTVNICGGIYTENIVLPSPMALMGDGLVIVNGSITISSPGKVQNMNFEPSSGPGIIITGGRPNFINVSVEVGDTNAIRITGITGTLKAVNCELQNDSSTFATVDCSEAGVDFMNSNIENDTNGGLAFLFSSTIGTDSASFFSCQIRGTVQCIAANMSRVIRLDNCTMDERGLLAAHYAIIAGDGVIPGRVEVYNTRITSIGVGPNFAHLDPITSSMSYGPISLTANSGIGGPGTPTAVVVLP